MTLSMTMKQMRIKILKILIVRMIMRMAMMIKMRGPMMMIKIRGEDDDDDDDNPGGKIMGIPVELGRHFAGKTNNVSKCSKNFNSSSLNMSSQPFINCKPPSYSIPKL